MAELRRWNLAAFAIGLVTTTLFVCRDASAQLHWDASAQLGGMKRFLSANGSNSDAGFGPTGQLTGHVALLPLVHVGGYFGHDISPLAGDRAARNITFGGVRAKGNLPLGHGSWRAWVFAGFGFAGVYSQSYSGKTFLVPTGFAGEIQPRPGRVEGAGGHFFEVPFGLGASYKLYKPWELCAELGMRVGFAHSGSVYEDPGPQLSIENLPAAGQNVAPAGLDRFAVGLTVGVLIDL